MDKWNRTHSHVAKLIFISIILLLPLGCKQKEETKQGEEASRATPPSGEVSHDKSLLATVNGRPIYEGDLNEKSLDDVIIDEILYEEGVRRGLDKKLKTNNKNDNTRRGLLVEIIKQQIINNTPEQQTPTKEEIEDYYKKHEKKYVNLKVTGISVNDKKMADKIHKRAVRGEDMNKIASDSPNSNVKLISTPFFLTNDKNDNFNSFEIGTISDVVQDSGNFIIYKVIDLYRFSLSTVKPSIIYAIEAKKKYQAVREFAEKARKEKNIRVVIIKEKT